MKKCIGKIVHKKEMFRSNGRERFSAARGFLWQRSSLGTAEVAAGIVYRMAKYGEHSLSDLTQWGAAA